MSSDVGRTFCVAELCGGQQPAPVLGVLDVELDQVFLLQVQQVVHCLVAVEQQGGSVLLQRQRSPITTVIDTERKAAPVSCIEAACDAAS